MLHINQGKGLAKNPLKVTWSRHANEESALEQTCSTSFASEDHTNERKSERDPELKATTAACGKKSNEIEVLGVRVLGVVGSPSWSSGHGQMRIPKQRYLEFSTGPLEGKIR